MIKKFKVGIMTYLFEVKSEEYKTPCEVFGLTPIMQRHYIPEAGSVVRYGTTFNMEIVNEELDFPESECKDPSPVELKMYESLSLV